MTWEVENTDEFGDWYIGLSEADQAAIAVIVDRLSAKGPHLRFPHSSGISNSPQRIDKMSGHRPFSDLMKDWSPERRARHEAHKAKFEAELVSLEQLRERLGLSQEELANLMDVQQPAISKLVRRSDMKVSTLRELITAMGGELHITATFAGRSVEIDNFQSSAA